MHTRTQPAQPSLTSFDYFDDVYSLRLHPRCTQHFADYSSDRSHVVWSVCEKLQNGIKFYIDFVLLDFLGVIDSK